MNPFERADEQLDETVAELEQAFRRRANPWIDTFGRSADDPQWEEYQEALRRIRKEENGTNDTEEPG